MLIRTGLVIVSLVLLMPAGSATALEIVDFRSGLVCADKESFSWICFETEEIYITGQGECNWGGEIRICTWYGFEFYYRDAKPGDEIDCRSESTVPKRIGNPEAVETETAKVHEYSFQLNASEGRFFNPQYSLFAVRPPGDGKSFEETVCFHKGEKVFEFRRELNFAEIDLEED